MAFNISPLIKLCHNLGWGTSCNGGSVRLCIGGYVYIVMYEMSSTNEHHQKWGRVCWTIATTSLGPEMVSFFFLFIPAGYGHKGPSIIYYSCFIVSESEFTFTVKNGGIWSQLLGTLSLEVHLSAWVPDQSWQHSKALSWIAIMMFCDSISKVCNRVANHQLAQARSVTVYNRLSKVSRSDELKCCLWRTINSHLHFS